MTDTLATARAYGQALGLHNESYPSIFEQYNLAARLKQEKKEIPASTLKIYDDISKAGKEVSRYLYLYERMKA